MDKGDPGIDRRSADEPELTLEEDPSDGSGDMSRDEREAIGKAIKAAWVRFVLDSIGDEKKELGAHLLKLQFHLGDFLSGDLGAAYSRKIPGRVLADYFHIEEWEVSRLLKSAKKRFAECYKHALNEE